MTLDRYFLIVFDGGLIEARDVGTDAETAAIVYAEAERAACGSGVEIVLLGADSLDTLRVTHAHYFDARPQ